MESIRAEAKNPAGVLSGRVKIGSIPSAAIAFLPKVVGHFTREHPNVEVILLEEPSQDMAQLLGWLRGAVIDIAIMELPVRGVHIIPFLQDELCALVPSSSPAANALQLSIKELSKQSFIMSRYSSERLIRVAYATHKLSRNIRFEVHDLGTLISLVREGLGISIVPRISFPNVPEGVALISLRPRLTRELGFVMRPRAQSSAEVQAFIRNAREIADELVTGH
jgi:DNA-binding transcriptional LysR family regulator